LLQRKLEFEFDISGIEQNEEVEVVTCFWQKKGDVGMSLVNEQHNLNAM
jgi:hypothetical protein